MRLLERWSSQYGSITAQVRNGVRELAKQMAPAIDRLYRLLERRKAFSRQKAFEWNDLDDHEWIARHLETPEFRILCVETQNTNIAIFMDRLLGDGDLTAYRYYPSPCADRLREINEETAREAADPYRRIMHADYYDNVSDEVPGNGCVRRPTLEYLVRGMKREVPMWQLTSLFCTSPLSDSTSNWVSADLHTLMDVLDMLLGDADVAKELATRPDRKKQEVPSWRTRWT